MRRRRAPARGAPTVIGCRKFQGTVEPLAHQLEVLQPEDVPARGLDHLELIRLSGRGVNGRDLPDQAVDSGLGHVLVFGGRQHHEGTRGDATVHDVPMLEVAEHVGEVGKRTVAFGHAVVDVDAQASQPAADRGAGSDPVSQRHAQPGGPAAQRHAGQPDAVGVDSLLGAQDAGGSKHFIGDDADLRSAVRDQPPVLLLPASQGDAPRLGALGVKVNMA